MKLLTTLCTLFSLALFSTGCTKPTEPAPAPEEPAAAEAPAETEGEAPAEPAGDAAKPAEGDAAKPADPAVPETEKPSEYPKPEEKKAE